MRKIKIQKAIKPSEKHSKDKKKQNKNFESVKSEKKFGNKKSK